jgi:hypothetical protein
MFNVQRAFGSSFALPGDEVTALPRPRLTQTIAVWERFPLALTDDKRKA